MNLPFAVCQADLHEQSNENKKQAEILRTQIAGLQELFLRAENVDRERVSNTHFVLASAKERVWNSTLALLLCRM